MSTSAPVHPAALPIPVDLFVSKKLRKGDFAFSDSSGKLLFRLTRISPSKASPSKMTLLDASGTPLVSTYRQDDGSWQGFKGDGDGEKELLFKVKRTLSKLTRSEMEVFLVAEGLVESSSDFKMKGLAFQRSCTIYRGSSIVAQTSLMYKLHEFFKIVGRSKFRLTIFPGSVDGVLVVALTAIFLYGHKQKPSR